MSAPTTPPGWVRLIAAGGSPLWLRLSAIQSVIAAAPYTQVAADGTWQVEGSPEDTLAAIDEAERARRRFEALPMMAATLLAAAPSGDCDWAARRALALLDAIERLEAARPLDEWHDDIGCVLWWRFPICEPPYVGDPRSDDWPGYHTHWTPIVYPLEPEGARADG